MYCFLKGTLATQLYRIKFVLAIYDKKFWPTVIISFLLRSGIELILGWISSKENIWNYWAWLFKVIKFTILHSTLVNWYLFALSMILCLMHGLGFYGYGNDFYASYSGQNLRWGGIFDIVGFCYYPPYIYLIYIWGVYLTTFAIMFSFGYFAKSFLFCPSSGILNIQ